MAAAASRAPEQRGLAPRQGLPRMKRRGVLLQRVEHCRGHLVRRNRPPLPRRRRHRSNRHLPTASTVEVAAIRQRPRLLGRRWGRAHSSCGLLSSVVTPSRAPFEALTPLEDGGTLESSADDLAAYWCGAVTAAASYEPSSPRGPYERRSLAFRRRMERQGDVAAARTRGYASRQSWAHRTHELPCFRWAASPSSHDHFTPVALAHARKGASNDFWPKAVPRRRVEHDDRVVRRLCGAGRGGPKRPVRPNKIHSRGPQHIPDKTEMDRCLF